MSASLKAGLFVIAAVASLVYMTTKLTQNRFAFAGTKRYFAYVRDATGLLNKSKIKMAGLDVGQIENIELIEKRARLTMIIGGEVSIRRNSTVSVKSIGFLGDKYVELSPGTDDQPELPEGSNINEGAGAGGIEDLTGKVTKLVENLQDITDVLKSSLRGDDDDGTTRLDRIAENIEDFSAGLAGLNRVGDLTEKLDEVAENLRTISSKVARGEGTIGKLLNDERTIEGINEAVSGVNKFLSKADKLQLILDARTGVLTQSGGAKTQVGLWIQPTYDKYYLLGVSSGPQGFVTRTHVETNNGGAVTSTDTLLQNRTTVLFNAQFAKRFSDFIIRAGIFENQGGLALDYVGFMEQKIKLVTELYNFQPDLAPQFNLGAEVHVWRPFYLWAGGDDVLVRKSTLGRQRNFFIGAGVRFSDSDVKTLVTTVPR
jgi:phospholipid/cholesterol/gamma-HCH transport system substrate-binding protein